MEFKEKLQLLTDVNEKYANQGSNYIRAKQDYRKLVEELNYLLENGKLKYDIGEYEAILNDD